MQRDTTLDPGDTSPSRKPSSSPSPALQQSIPNITAYVGMYYPQSTATHYLQQIKGQCPRVKYGHDVKQIIIQYVLLLT
jgi:hypothetical protein